MIENCSLANPVTRFGTFLIMDRIPEYVFSGSRISDSGSKRIFLIAWLEFIVVKSCKILWKLENKSTLKYSFSIAGAGNDPQQGAPLPRRRPALQPEKVQYCIKFITITTIPTYLDTYLPTYLSTYPLLPTIKEKIKRHFKHFSFPTISWMSCLIVIHIITRFFQCLGSGSGIRSFFTCCDRV